MPVNYEWTPETGKYVETPEEEQKLIAIYSQINSVVSCVEKWVDDPRGATGIAYLSESQRHSDIVMTILRQLETNSHREMSRFTDIYGFFKSFFYAAKQGRLDGRLAFGSGMKVQRYLDALRRLRDEWKQIKEFAVSNS